MKQLIIVALIAILFGCGSTVTKEASDLQNKEMTLVVNHGTWFVYKVTIDSVDYLVAKGLECISIIKK